MAHGFRTGWNGWESVLVARSEPRSGSTAKPTQAKGRRRASTSTADDPKIDPSVSFEPREEFHNVCLQRIAVERRGSGRPLLLINGIGATGELFLPFQESLWNIDQRETITFDAPGVGRSSTPVLPMAMWQLAGVVNRLIDSLGHDQVDVLGLSWGGALAQELAIRYPHRVRKLVLAATMHGIGALPGRPAALTIMVTPARYYSPEYLERVAPTLYGGLIRQQRGLLAEHARVRAERPPSPVGYAWQLAAIAGWSSLPWLCRLRQPTLLLAGDDDPIIPAVNARTMARCIPESELHIIEGGGHLFLYLRPDDMARRVVEFLDADLG